MTPYKLNTILKRLAKLNRFPFSNDPIHNRHYHPRTPRILNQKIPPPINPKHMENDVEPPPDYKLCGYLCAVLTVPTDASAPLNSICRVAGENAEAYFTAQNGVRLDLIGKSEAPDSKAMPSTKKRWNRIGMVHGSISVVHQLHALVAHKCLRILARIVHVSPRRSEVDGGSGSGIREIRAVVLVDVYLPLYLWSGWQFPRSSSIAAALFKHLRCFFCWFVFCNFPFLFV